MKDEQIKPISGHESEEQNGDGSGAPQKPRMQKRWKRKQAFMKGAKNLAEEAASAILGASPHPDLLSRKDRERITAAFRRVLFPPKKAGRPRSPQVTSAWQDWKNGTRGVKLYRRHIPNYASMSNAERAVAVRTLMSSVRKRQRCAENETSPSPATAS